MAITVARSAGRAHRCVLKAQRMVTLPSDGWRCADHPGQPGQADDRCMVAHGEGVTRRSPSGREPMSIFTGRHGNGVRLERLKCPTPVPPDDAAAEVRPSGALPEAREDAYSSLHPSSW